MKAHSLFKKALLGSCVCVMLGLISCEPPEETLPEILTPTLDCDFFTTDRVLVDNPDLSVDYRINCLIPVEADLVIEPGVVIEFTSEAGIEIFQTGSISALGSATSPITFRGEVAGVGTWKGIRVDSKSAANALEFVDIIGAGGSTFNSNNDLAAIVIWADAKLRIRACQIEGSGGHGISAIYINSDWSIEESTISTCQDAPIIMLPSYLASLNGSNAYSGNGLEEIVLALETDAILESINWTRAAIPYRVRSTFNLFEVLSIEGGETTIEAGTEIRFEDGTGLKVGQGASLSIAGEANNEVVLRGVNDLAGSWNGLYIIQTQSPQNRIEFTRIEHAGSEYDGVKAGIVMQNNPRLHLQNVSFRNIDGCSVLNRDIMDNPNFSSDNLNHENTTGTLCTE